MITNQNFSMIVGDSKQIIVTVTKEDGTILDITGSSIKWGFDTVTKTNSNGGITINNPTGGQFTIKLNPVDTQGKTTYTSYNHQAEITDPSGNVSTVLSGLITLINSTI